MRDVDCDGFEGPGCCDLVLWGCADVGFVYEGRGEGEGAVGGEAFRPPWRCCGCGCPEGVRVDDLGVLVVG